MNLVSISFIHIEGSINGWQLQNRVQDGREKAEKWQAHKRGQLCKLVDIIYKYCSDTYFETISSFA